MTGADPTVRIAVPPAIDPRSAEEFADAVQRAVADPDKRVIVLGGGNGVFCKGLNVFTLEDRKTSVTALAEILLSLRRAPITVISVVDGVALGGGVGLAAASDLVIASEDSSFGLPEALIGLAPAIILPFLLERMRPQEVRLWALSAYARSAAEAARAGLVDVVVPAADLDRQTTHWVRQLSRAHSDGVGRVKRVTAEAASMNLETAVRKGIDLTSQLLNDSAVIQRFRDIASDKT